ncbi:Putative tRNA (cytidine(34)-2'-O)-methyltransferase,putative rRNA methylase,tRNA (cytidine(34)-2'-O)-methyltransferase,SpoU rRNA Methylase family [Chlamydia serpentis]|uniref:Putative tRNA (cytidine(34)-2'-O)-methyltransferase n=1 Tax=Chlamydia serpentis TaxID=1967782 RepID=A0A2R8FBH2_9CHLA|nr:tRNA (cytidine(34)-2'-O)-methyltransferase [Chlamydia serpentis]SPN73779.1 Putative tRNA (cytidine(34)-2'-O)-methyltransferase,putative rRNA methylase,tRNA (cytidine(34)-2'-O)-methyltransferase,SpoU rRNA Methylase family [Chlamydia serpentis]
MRVVLYCPDIPQNTGNIGRTCVALGAELVLVRPLGFSLLDKFVKRAGMDYWGKVQLTVVDSLEEALKDIPEDYIFCLSTKGSALYTEAALPYLGTYVFGSESKGLPEETIKKYYKNCFRIPMHPRIRSLNLATSVGIILYEVVRQDSLKLQC